jgi:hypothetical protein
MELKENKQVVVSPKWKLITKDLKDLLSDFLWGCAGLGITMLLDYLNTINLAGIVGDDNVVYASLVVGFFTTFLSRVLKKVQKESNYNTNS